MAVINFQTDGECVVKTDLAIQWIKMTTLNFYIESLGGFTLLNILLRMPACQLKKSMTNRCLKYRLVSLICNTIVEFIILFHYRSLILLFYLS